MPEPASASPTDDGFLAPRRGGAPVDHCFRCGVATAPGQGLCPEHNPNRLPGPSSTQMHATIFGGVAIGVLAFFLIARFAISGSGPFSATVTAGAVDAAGAMSLDMRITNEGDSDGVADCRVTRDGYPRVDDAVFRTVRLASGQSVALQQDLRPPPLGTAPYDPERASVVCD